MKIIQLFAAAILGHGFKKKKKMYCWKKWQHWTLPQLYDPSNVLWLSYITFSHCTRLTLARLQWVLKEWWERRSVEKITRGKSNSKSCSLPATSFSSFNLSTQEPRLSRMFRLTHFWGSPAGPRGTLVHGTTFHSLNVQGIHFNPACRCIT